MIAAHRRPAGARARENWIGELLQCPCRHGAGRHWATGCEGDLRGPCGCRLTRDGVLEVAIAIERYDPERMPNDPSLV